MSQDPTAPDAPNAPEAKSRSASQPHEAGDSPPLPGDAFHDIGPRFAELLEYLSFLVAAKIDAYKASVRKAGLWTAIGVVGLLALVTFIITTMVLLCVGVAQMFAALFGGRAWAGNLLAAILFLALIAGAIFVGYRRLTRSSRERTMAKYAQRKQQQRSKFGTDVQERAENPASSNLSEADFLARQANDAKAAIVRVSADIAGDVARTVDPRGWIQVAPWTTLAAAALVAFAGTALVVPSKEEQALRRLRRLERALGKEERRDRHDSNGHDDEDDDRKKGDHTFLGMLAGHALGLLKPLITSAVSAVLTARSAQPDPTAQPGAGDGASGASPDGSGV